MRSEPEIGEDRIPISFQELTSNTETKLNSFPDKLEENIHAKSDIIKLELQNIEINLSDVNTSEGKRLL